MSDHFDFEAFMKRLRNMSPEDVQQMRREELRDTMADVISEVAPRLWTVMLDQMQDARQDETRLNAILNAYLFATLSWVAIFTNPGQEDVLRSNVNANLEGAFKGRSDENTRSMTHIANNLGRLKLMDDSHAGLAKVLLANSSVIQGIHRYLKGDK